MQVRSRTPEAHTVAPAAPRRRARSATGCTRPVISDDLLDALVRVNPAARADQGLAGLRMLGLHSDDAGRLVLAYLSPKDRRRLERMHHVRLPSRQREAHVFALARGCGFREKPPLEPWVSYLTRLAAPWQPRRCKTYDGVMLGAIISGSYLRCDLAIRGYPSDANMVLAALANYPRGIERADPALRDDPAFFARAIAVDPKAVEFGGPHVIDDETLMFMAVRRAPENFRHCSERLRAKHAFARFAMSLDANNLQWAIEPTREMVLEQVRRDGMVLKHAGAWCDDDGVVLEAITQNGRALEFAGKAQRSMLSMVRVATRSNACNMQHADDSVRANEAFALEVAAYGPSVVHHVAEPLSHNIGFLLRAIGVNAACYKSMYPSMKGERALAVPAVRALPALEWALPSHLRVNPAFRAEAGLAPL